MCVILTIYNMLFEKNIYKLNSFLSNITGVTFSWNYILNFHWPNTCSKSTIKTSENVIGRSSSVFTVDFEHVLTHWKRANMHSQST